MSSVAVFPKRRAGQGSRVLIASSLVKRRARWADTLRTAYIVHEVSEEDLLESLVTVCPDVVLLDVANGEAANSIAVVRRSSPSSKIILLTSKPHQTEAMSVLKAGARGYCHADIEQYVLTIAVEAVQKGEVWIGRNLIRYLLEELVASRRADLLPGLPA